MKRFFFIQILFVVLLLSNCTTSRCDLVDCRNGGVCEDGTCICEPGYWGESCEETWIAKFVGSYLGDSPCLEFQFNSAFMRQTTLSGIITNFENTGFSLDVEMVNTNRFEFNEIILGTDRYSGYGTIQSDLSIKLVYLAERDYNTINLSPESCTVQLDRF